MRISHKRDHLEDNIRRVIADIRPQMLEKVIENWTSRLDYIRGSRGSPMPEIIFKSRLINTTNERMLVQRHEDTENNSIEDENDIQDISSELDNEAFDQVSEFDRGSIVAYRDCGLYFREIGSRVGRYITTVIRIYDRWKHEGTTDRRGRSHPPQCTTSRDDRQIVRMAVTDR
ncbi:transposable element Tcb1 transposase [Trichonephila clavipes]|nr:transposable element Tcb1 transposase [Trichonephila clavipes]